MSTFRRYILFQIPGWVLAIIILGLLHQWAGLSLRLAVSIYALYVLKDFVLYPFLKHAYSRDAKTGAERLIGLIGIAREPIDPAGYIWVHGELWRAEVEPGHEPIVAGATVRVEGFRGITLKVVLVEEV